jgi:two-component system, NtrC family, nitrogen regulation sensor histidine kinase NtrY
LERNQTKTGLNFSPFNRPRFAKRNLIFASALLLLLSFFSSYYFRQNPSIGGEVKKLQNYVLRQQKDFELLLRDSSLMGKLVRQQETLTEFKNIADKEYSFFLYAETLSDQGQLLFWNNQKVLPTVNDLSLTEGEFFQRLSNGYYVIIKRRVKLSDMSNYVVAYALIPVFYQYEAESNYLINSFAHDKSASKKIALSDTKTQHQVLTINRQHLFYVAQKPFSSLLTSDPITLLLRIAALLLLLAYLQFVAEMIIKNYSAVKASLFLASALILIRLLLYLFPSFFYLRQFHLFDPGIYGTNWLNRSLGDLLINTIFFCWVAVFVWQNMGPIKRLPSFLKGNRIYIAGVLALFFLILSTFELANIVRSLVSDSKISFSVTDFFSLDIYTIVGFVVLALMSLGYYYFTRILFRFIFPAFEKRTVFIYFIIAAVGLAYLSFQSGNSQVLFHIPVLLWLVIYTLLVSQEQFIINHFKVTMAGILFWIFIFSVSLATVILKENKKKEWIFRKTVAEKQHELTDPSQARTLKIALVYLDNDFLAANFNRFANAYTYRYLRDSIINDNLFASYKNAYTTKIFVFDSLNRSLYNEESRSYADLNDIYTMRSKPTGIPDLYYHETSFDNLTYITKRVIQRNGSFVGTFFIISTPKKYSSDGFFPELFKHSGDSDIENLPSYSFAIYYNNLLISASNKYPFRTSLTSHEIPKSEFERRANGDFDELWYKASNNKVVVIAKKRDSLIESITLFSYLFCAFLFMVGLMQLIAFLLNVFNVHGNIFSSLSIRSQVHGTIIFISILSFLIIGAATISFFISRYNRNNIDKLSRTSGIMVREMQKRIQDQSIFDDVLKIYDSLSNADLQKLIEEVSDIHDVDVNVYTLQGNLRVSSRPEYYNWGVLSTKIHPEAFYHLSRLREVQYVQEESMSSLSYQSMYAPVRDDKGEVYAYLNIPYFSSQLDLNQEISNFLVTIINLNAFIFLIAGVIALFITNKITRSFSIIGDKMKEVRLGKTNEEIEWNYKDEIGELVQQYNKMVRQLEQSAEALAKSEREGAWREMARQVAHEIKNPLTPMKLSIQYLQKAINNNQSNVKELTSNVANTLIEQIDHLSKIAADFSRFANIGNKNVEVLDLHQVLSSLVGLYSADPKVKLEWDKVQLPLKMKADKTHMNRLFTNLLTNAVDACANEEKCLIKIKEEANDGHVLIQVKDNGEGIPEETRSKIFVPNFTTKTSGTGLGLAMCKSIVEQAGGDIWFETETDKGTTFFVQLPLLK